MLNKPSRLPAGNALIIIVTLAVTALVVYCYPHGSTNRYKYKVGQVWNYAKLVAPYDIDIYPDSLTVSKRVDSIRASHIPVYTPRPIDVNSMIKQVDSLIMKVPDSVAFGGFFKYPDTAPFIKEVNNILLAAYKTGVYSENTTNAQSTKQKYIKIASSPTELTKVAVDSVLTPSKLYERLDKAATRYNCHPILINSGVNGVLTESMVYDTDLNTSILNQAIGEAKAPNRRIVKNETIVDNGTVINEEIYNWLQNYERVVAERETGTARSELMTVIGQIFYVLLLMAVLLGYIYFYDPMITRSVKTMIFLLSMIGLFIVFEALLNAFIPGKGVYIVPLVIIPILLLVYLNGRVALMTGFVTTLLVAPMAIYSLEFIFLQFVAMSIAVYSLRDLSQRSQLLRTSAMVIGAYLISYTALTVMANGSFDNFSWRMIGSLTLSGALTAMAYVLMSLIERMFGFVSNVTLVELSDTNNPLLRQLSDECPGTFQHSIAVSNLAAEAARLIGANPTLTRAGALYHDIGKLKNPIFFTENQHGVTPHDGLSPIKSAEIIISHVSEGLKRAEKAGLPAVIRDFIAQHHGKGQAKYFYYTYCKQHPDENVDPAPFTYPGPNPLTREASVLMMADAVEAASRSLKEHTPEAIKSLVDKIIDSQIADGLHNDSALSFRDVSTIKDTFTRRLMTMYHSRISYPDDPNKKKSPTTA
ncbi:MAG: HDIG domain-containing protein [Muribaculaceae bacterium]|nr:HDIG domain-containing protein [Muribaculaceae bacterium]MBO5187497.1 HDIG domain-containing protein [Prevotella sp.]